MAIRGMFSFGGSFINAFRGNKNSRNRFFMFRNIDRLRALKRWNWLFVPFYALSVLLIMAASLAWTVWLIVSVVSLGFAASSVSNYLKYGLYGLLAGMALMFAVFFVRWLIERIYVLAEKRELKQEPEGAEKYLHVMKFYTGIASYVGLAMLLLCVVCAAMCYHYFVKEGDKVMGCVAIGGLFVVLIINGIYNSMQYKKIKPYIDEIKAERNGAPIKKEATTKTEAPALDQAEAGEQTQAAPTKCRGCGAAIDQSSENFCPHCGTRFKI